MANAQNSESDREAMLRRVAIVLSSLPAAVASELLGSIDPQSKQAVHRTMTSLVDVDPLERQRALRAFKVSLEQLPKVTPTSTAPAETVEDEAMIGQRAAVAQPTSRVVSSSLAPSGASETDPSPLSFLGDVDDDTLVRLLSVEHPQAIALVLASIAPPQAARVLPRLSPQTQSDALGRIGRLGDIPEAAVAEVAEHFRNRVAEQSSSQRSATGQRALDAILAALPSSEANSTATVNPPSAHQEVSHPPETQPITAVDFPAANVPATDLTHKLRVAEHTLSHPHDEANHVTLSPSASSIDGPPLQHPRSDQMQTQWQRAEHGAAERAEVPADSAPRLDSTDAIHQYLLRLTPALLCQSLGRVETRYAMLALCGLPNEIAEAVFEILPRAQAKQVRTKMNSLGSLHLREIDEAKEKVARVSVVSGDERPSEIPMAA